MEISKCIVPVSCGGSSLLKLLVLWVRLPCLQVLWNFQTGYLFVWFLEYVFHGYCRCQLALTKIGSGTISGICLKHVSDSGRDAFIPYSPISLLESASHPSLCICKGVTQVKGTPRGTQPRSMRYRAAPRASGRIYIEKLEFTLKTI